MTQKFWKYLPWRWITGFLVLVLAIVVIDYALKHHLCAFAPGTPASPICNVATTFFDIVFVVFAVGTLATLTAVCIGQSHLQKLVQASEDQRSLGNLRTFWRIHPSTSTEFTIVVGHQESKSGDTTPYNLRVTHETLLAVAAITTILHRVYGRDLISRVVHFRNIERISKEGQGANFVLLGGDKAIPGTTTILNDVQLPYRQDCTDENNKRIYLKNAEETNWKTRIDAESQKLESAKHFFNEEFAMISRIITTEKTLWIQISGNMGIGTVMAARALADPAMVSKVMGDKDGLLDADAQQAVFCVNNKTRHNIQEEPIEPTLANYKWEPSLSKSPRRSVHDLLKTLTPANNGTTPAPGASS